MKEKEEKTTVQKTEEKKQDTNIAERFVGNVIARLQENFGVTQTTNLQKKLIQSYFIKLDQILTKNEIDRMATDVKYRTAVPYTWQYVNMEKLSQEVVAYSEVGLDPLQPNHIHMIPYLNKKSGKFDIGFILGFNGLELKARKYGLDVPDDIVIEVVYSNDHFKEIKRDFKNEIENYEFEIKNAFDRGDLIGGFWYKKYFKTPQKNRIQVFNNDAIRKRQPKNAAPEFWGGEKAIWKEGKKTNEKEVVEGWADEMYFKTVKRNAWSSIPIDPEKIDESLKMILANESDTDKVAEGIKEEINANANKGVINLDDIEKKPDDGKEVEEEVIADEDVVHEEDDSVKKGETGSLFDTGKGPGF